MKMKPNKLLSSLIAVFAGIVLFAPSSALAAAFGVSPPWIENNNLRPGDNFVYVINLSASDLSEDMIVQPELQGDPEIMQWLTILNKDNLVMTKGQGIVPMSVAVNIPNNANIGKYEGSLRLSLAARNGNTDNVAVLLGSNIAVKLGVINYDVTDYWIQAISTNPITAGQPIGLNMDIKNLGNTEISNVMTKVSVIDMKTGVAITSGSTDTLNIPVYPQTAASAELSFLAPDLEAGNYWLDVESFKDGGSVYKNRLFLTVNPQAVNNTVSTGVEVTKEGQVKPAAFDESPTSNGTSIKTSVKVRAPYTDKLILVVIGILVILTGIVIKIYLNFSKKRRR